MKLSDSLSPSSVEYYTGNCESYIHTFKMAAAALGITEDCCSIILIVIIVNLF